ncbi:MAG: M23 family peptidase, partial [Gammaproteobacteria bacterium]|nr:M23 family peptidase [Gammaproteobacteria bacterium]
MRWLPILLLLVSSNAALALPAHAPVPGGVAIIEVPEMAGAAPRATYRDRRVMVLPGDDQYRAIVGLPLSTKPGEHKLQLKGTDGSRAVISFTVTDKAYAEQRLTITNKRKVNPYAEDMDQIRADRKRINAALESWSEPGSVQLEMIRPVDGIESSPFGLRRFYNDEPRNPHSGLDIAADTG